MNFTPGSRSFSNLMQDASADFTGLTEPEPKPDFIPDFKLDVRPAPQCTQADESRERRNIIARYGIGWEESIKGERQKVIAANVREGEEAEATLGPLESQIGFSECKVAYVAVRYVWRINIYTNGRAARVLNVPRQRRWICGKVMGGWTCRAM